MKVVKTEKLVGAALDWAVAKLEGWHYELHPDACEYLVSEGAVHHYVDDAASPSIEWSQGGPLIEREHIYLMPGCGTLASVGAWDARIDDPEGEPWLASGPTPLVAAMRCYVASRVGEETEVPDVLVA